MSVVYRDISNLDMGGIGEAVSDLANNVSGIGEAVPDLANSEVYALGELIEGGEVNASTEQSSSLINWDDFNSDPLYSGIDGGGYSVVIIDSGIDVDHSFFGADLDSNGVADRIVYQYDYVNNDTDATDDNGHGSNVTSIIASQDGTNHGMATGVNIISLKVLNAAGSGTGAALEAALQWVAANVAAYNIVAVNMSIGFGYNDDSPVGTFMSDEIASIASQGVAVVSAAGNDYYTYQQEGVDIPGSDANSWAVGAVYDSNVGSINWGSGARDFSTGADRITSFSQRSEDMVDIFAPGAFITGAGPNGGTVSYGGTSQAAPHIAGIVALAQDLSEEITSVGSAQKLDLATLRGLMRSTGATINDGDDENDNVTNTGKDYQRVDVDALMDGIVAYYQTATSGSDTIYGWRGDDVLSGEGGNDFIYGNDGNDTFYGNSGNDTIDGGNDTDLAGFDNLARTYSIGWNGASAAGAVATGGTDGTDTLTSIEMLSFMDGYYLSGNAAVTARMYDSAFNRDPDEGGLMEWTASLDDGMSIVDLGYNFILSAEFIQTYGGLNNSEFVTLLYYNVLDRIPDQAGLNSWVDMLDNNSATQAEILYGFSESPEHIGMMASQFDGSAIWVGDTDAMAIARLYYSTLDRAPDAGGLYSWITAYENGTEFDSIASGFINSVEFQNVYGSLDDDQFVTLLYSNVLDRAPDQEGFDNWTDGLGDNTYTREDVVIGFSNSLEFEISTAPYMEDGIILV